MDGTKEGTQEETRNHVPKGSRGSCAAFGRQTGRTLPTRGRMLQFHFYFFFVGFLELSLRLGSALIMRTRTVTLCLIP